MVRNKVNDNGLEFTVPKAIKDWYHCRYEIKKLEKLQKECSRSIKHELDNARESGYSDKDIKELMGDVVIPSWYLIGKNKNGDIK